MACRFGAGVTVGDSVFITHKLAPQGFKINSIAVAQASGETGTWEFGNRIVRK